MKKSRHTKIDSKRFVIHAPDTRESSLKERLADIGEIEKGGGTHDIIVNVKAKNVNAKKMWALLRERLGDDLDVDPVFEGERNDVQYPSGQIMVRFSETPTAARLKAFSDRHNLQLDRVNDYVPQQVAFKKRAGSKEFLPDLLETIEKGESDVQAVWPETYSRYRRA